MVKMVKMFKTITFLLLINLKFVYNFSLSNKNYNSPEIINQLSRENYKLVYYFSKNYIKKHKLNKEQCNDLIQEGFIGLMFAARKYDENNYANAKFTTYSGLWIKGYMTKYIKQMYTNNHMLLNEEIVKTYDQDNIIISIFDLDILDSLERDIITKRYICRPRVITSILASEYNKTFCDIIKINNKALKKLREQYIIENNITYLQVNHPV